MILVSTGLTMVAEHQKTNRQVIPIIGRLSRLSPNAEGVKKSKPGVTRFARQPGIALSTAHSLTVYSLMSTHLRLSFLRYRSRLTGYDLPAAIPLHPHVHT